MSFRASKYFASRVRSLRRLAVVSAVRSEQYSFYSVNVTPLFVVRILQEEPRPDRIHDIGHPGMCSTPIIMGNRCRIIATAVKVYQFCDYGAMHNIVLRSAGLSVHSVVDLL